MGISHYQEVVIQYITSDPAMLISEEYYITFEYAAGRYKTFWVDALAVDIRQYILYLVEISYAKKPRALTRKMNEYAAYEDNIRAALAGGRGISEAWQLRPWAFILESASPYVLTRLERDAAPKLTFIEHTPFPWIYEKRRYEGSEPGKPYAAVPREYQ